MVLGTLRIWVLKPSGLPDSGVYLDLHSSKELLSVIPKQGVEGPLFGYFGGPRNYVYIYIYMYVYRGQIVVLFFPAVLEGYV